MTPISDPKIRKDVPVRSGLNVALWSGCKGYVPRTRVMPFEAAIAACCGFQSEPALSLVTYPAAQILDFKTA